RHATPIAICPDEAVGIDNLTGPLHAFRQEPRNRVGNRLTVINAVEVAVASAGRQHGRKGALSGALHGVVALAGKAQSHSLRIWSPDAEANLAIQQSSAVREGSRGRDQSF